MISVGGANESGQSWSAAHGVAGSSGDASLQMIEKIKLGYLFLEKCEVRRARVVFTEAREQAAKARNLRWMMEALAGLLRVAGITRDPKAIEATEHELNQLMTAFPEHVPSLAWYCKGVIVLMEGDSLLAQRYFHRFLREVRKDPEPVVSSEILTPDEKEARGWLSLALTLHTRGKYRRAEWLANQLLNKYGSQELKSINGTLYLLIGNIEEGRENYTKALEWFHKAHSAFMKEHNWYYYLRVLWAYARIARLQQNFVQANWYLDLVEQATQDSEFGELRAYIASEREALESDAVDLLIDYRSGIVQTREGGEVKLGKQFVLLDILGELGKAHEKQGEDDDRGLSKAELIQRVWKEKYRPDTHDNKLYYNINRLRKILEPDMKNPKYLLNWKEGYRLGPGLRVQVVKSVEGAAGADHESKRRGGAK